MAILVPLGAILTLAGVGGLVWCIVRVRGARRAGLPEAELRRRLQSAIALNLGALLVSALGLAMVVVGLILGAV